jgi:hypothetical protein
LTSKSFEKILKKYVYEKKFGDTEAVYGRRTDNTMAKRQKDKQ